MDARISTIIKDTAHIVRCSAGGIMKSNIICVDYNLGQGHVPMHKIPCACPICFRQLSKLWVPGVDAVSQPARYKYNIECKYHAVLGSLLLT